MKHFPVGCRYPASGGFRAVTAPAWAWCDGRKLAHQAVLCKTLVYSKELVSNTLYPASLCYLLPQASVSVWSSVGNTGFSFSSFQCCQSKPRWRMHHLMFLQENVSVGVLSLCLQLSCQSHSSWFGTGHWHFSHWKADPVNIKQLPVQISSVSTMSSL